VPGRRKAGTDLTLVPIRGIGLLVAGVYPEIDLRATADVDLLARRTEQAQVEVMFQDLGLARITAPENERGNRHPVQRFRELEGDGAQARLHSTPFCS